MSLLSEKLAPIWSAINRLQARQMSIFPATVTSVNPVRIRIDGEERSLAATPDIGTSVHQGARVRVVRYGTTHLIIAVMGSTPWRDLTLQSGWTWVQSGGPPPQRRKVGDEVQLRGEIIQPNADSGSSNPITTLPAGWRPPGGRIRFVWGHGSRITHIHVASDGTVYSGGTPHDQSPGMFLDVVRFSTAER